MTGGHESLELGSFGDISVQRSSKPGVSTASIEGSGVFSGSK